MDTSRQISTDALWVWFTWTAAFATVVAATTIGIIWAEAPEARMLAISMMASALLMATAAVCRTVKVYMKKQTRLLLGVMSTREDAEQRIRKFPGS